MCRSVALCSMPVDGMLAVFALPFTVTAETLPTPFGSMSSAYR